MYNCKKCKFCGQSIFMDLRKHIVQTARHEVWQKSIGNITTTPHFDYYLLNTRPKTNVTRTWNKSNC